MTATYNHTLSSDILHKRFSAKELCEFLKANKGKTFDAYYISATGCFLTDDNEYLGDYLDADYNVTERLENAQFFYLDEETARKDFDVQVKKVDDAINGDDFNVRVSLGLASGTLICNNVDDSIKEVINTKNFDYDDLTDIDYRYKDITGAIVVEFRYAGNGIGGIADFIDLYEVTETADCHDESMLVPAEQMADYHHGQVLHIMIMTADDAEKALNKGTLKRELKDILRRMFWKQPFDVIEKYIEDVSDYYGYSKY